MTTTERPLDVTAGPPPPLALPRRSPLSRLSSGHLVMVVAGLVAVLLNYSALRARDDSVRVAVTVGEIRAGQTLTAADLAYTDARLDDALLATLVTPERAGAIEGFVATGALGPGELVRVSDLQAPSAPSAQRAMSIPIDTQHAVAGDLQAGDRIDIIEVSGRTAAYLVTDAEILAVPAPQSGGIAGGLRSFSVTIAVDDTTALRLAVAIRSGELELIRSTGSTQTTTERLDLDAGAGADGEG